MNHLLAIRPRTSGQSGEKSSLFNRGPTFNHCSLHINLIVVGTSLSCRHLERPSQYRRGHAGQLIPVLCILIEDNELNTPGSNLKNQTPIKPPLGNVGLALNNYKVKYTALQRINKEVNSGCLIKRVFYCVCGPRCHCTVYIRSYGALCT